MIDAFGVEISKSGVGAGRYVRAIDMPQKIRSRQLARLKAGKPQVASIKDQIFSSTRNNPTNFSSYIPKSKGTAIPTGRRKRKAELHNIDGKDIGSFSAVTVPNPRTNTNHVLVPDKSKTKGMHGFLLEHEKTHAKLRSRRLAQNQFKTVSQRLGEEARADATATIKTGRKRVPTSYPLAGNKNYEKVYTKITGRKPKFGISRRDLKEVHPTYRPYAQSKSETRRGYKRLARAINSQGEKARVGSMIQEAFTRRSPGPEYQSVRKPRLP
jgi:hypothetical protein